MGGVSVAEQINETAGKTSPVMLIISKPTFGAETMIFV